MRPLRRLSDVFTVTKQDADEAWVHGLPPPTAPVIPVGQRLRRSDGDGAPRQRYVARWLAARLGRILLITVFGVMTVRYVVPHVIVGYSIGAIPFGWDAIGYTRGARALLEGRDPWALTDLPVMFAGPPPSLIPFLPFVWMSNEAVAVTWVAIGLLSGLYIIRRLGLPWWWLMFPPLVHGITAGSGAVLALALMVRGTAGLDGLAVAARIYAGLPLLLLGRWRSLVAAGVIVAGTAPFLAWPLYLASRERIQDVFASHTDNLTAFAVPVLIPVAVVCLALLGRKRAAWLIVPALWPWTQHYYGLIALPVLGSMPLVALSLALPVPGLVVAGLVGQALWERLPVAAWWGRR